MFRFKVWICYGFEIMANCNERWKEGAKGASEHSRRISGLVSIKVSCA